MTSPHRRLRSHHRGLVAGTAAIAMTLAACGNSVPTTGVDRIDLRP